jgi:GMP synthase-like glutamine amidotransferase
MHVHVLQHVPFEGLGSIAAWLEARNAVVSHTRFFESAILPDPTIVDLVIALGGPMSVNDEHELPWLVAEKGFVRACIEANRAVLGICLGAQLIASALGARVYPHPPKEIGWLPIEAVPIPEGAFAFPPVVPVFHWHGETFDLPPDAVRLARSMGCESQAFQVGRQVMGLQFHLETTPTAADAILTHCRDELVDGPFIQAEAVIRSVPSSTYQRVNVLMAEVLDYLTRGVG